MRGNQQRALLEHLQTYGSLTSKEAFELYGATRLSAQIFDLRKKGHIIESTMCNGKTRYGDTCHYARYDYKGEIKDEKQ